MAVKSWCFYILYPLIELFNFLLSLTLLLFKLILCQEDGPHQLPNRWLNWHEELPGVSAINGLQKTTSLVIIIFLKVQGGFWTYITIVLFVSSILYTELQSWIKCNCSLELQTHATKQVLLFSHSIMRGLQEVCTLKHRLTTAGSWRFVLSHRNRCPSLRWPCHLPAGVLSTHKNK